MLYWIIQTTVVSIIFILVVHNIFIFLKDTLTVPKAKDLVDVHMEKYKHIYATLHTNNSNHISDNIQQKTDKPTNGTTNIDDIPFSTQEINKESISSLLPSINGQSNMKNELKNFMKKQLSNKQDNSDEQSSPVFMPL